MKFNYEMVVFELLQMEKRCRDTITNRNTKYSKYKNRSILWNDPSMSAQLSNALHVDQQLMNT